MATNSVSRTDVTEIPNIGGDNFDAVARAFDLRSLRKRVYLRRLSRRLLVFRDQSERRNASRVAHAVRALPLPKVFAGSRHPAGPRIKMRNRFSIALVGLTVIACGSLAVAQRQPQPRPPASDFNLEISNTMEGQPAYVATVPGAGKHGGLIANYRLHRIPAWKPSAEAPAEVVALKIDAWLEEAAVRVEVLAYFGPAPPGPRPADLAKLRKVKVASRLIHENETVSLNETESFGIEPIGLRVLRARPWSIGPPEITNKTQTLNVTGISEERPLYTVATRNVSTKCIAAIQWYAVDNGRRAGGSGLSGVCLIPAGRVFDIHQYFTLTEQAEAEGSQPQQPGKREIVIAALLFDDGTFEGEIDVATSMAARRAGMRIQYARIIQLFQAIAPTSAEGQSAVLSKLRSDVAALGEDVEPAIVEGLVVRFATASPDMRQRRIREEVRNSLRFIKNDLGHQIERFEYDRAHTPEKADFAAFIKRLTANAERWTKP
jgi:hypothetical protein